MQITNCFASPIALFKNENFDLTDHCLRIKNKYNMTRAKIWIYSPYTSLTISEKETGYNSLNDSNFSELIRWIQSCVDKFSKECGYFKMRLGNFWFNVYEKGDAQEFHNHPESHVSCVYYADVKDNDSKILFQRNPMSMFPIPVFENNVYNCDQVWYKPENGLLIVFKSDTMHMVERKVTDDIRISFSCNFNSTEESLDKTL